VPGDRGAQLRPAERFGVAERDPSQRLPGGREYRLRRAAARLTDLHVDDVGSGGGAGVGGGEHVHDDERIDLGTTRYLQAGNLGRPGSSGRADIEAAFSSVSPTFCHNRARSATDVRAAPAAACDHQPGWVAI
jgi:hypothetical protein